MSSCLIIITNFVFFNSFKNYESEGDDEEEDDEEENDELLKRFSKKKKTKKVGRKCLWNENIVDDLIDVIVENDKYKEKLLLTNTKNVKNGIYFQKVIDEVKTRCSERDEPYPYDIKQTRTKFKRCVSLCRAAALKIKTASGIKRFQEEKEFGKWFGKLFPVITSMTSCQREQAI